MAITVTCQCGRALSAPDRLAGKRAKCPACGEVVEVPNEDDDAFIYDLAQLERRRPIRLP